MTARTFSPGAIFDTPRLATATDMMDIAYSNATRAGVTRLADITGLDRIGIPVFQAVRPLGKTFSVSLGRGFSPEAAMVSALIEAIEIDHAERLVLPNLQASASELGVDQVFGQMPKARGQPSHFQCDIQRHWLSGRELISGAAIPVPFDLVSMDFTRDSADDLLSQSTGLASGSCLDEAHLFALCELVERDAHARWLASDLDSQRRCVLDLSGVSDDKVCEVIERIRSAGCQIFAWDLSQRYGIPTFICSIFEAQYGSSQLPPASGAACFPVKSVSLLRAISEAAQTRCGLVAGSREDIEPAWYASGQDRLAWTLLRGVGVPKHQRRTWEETVDFRSHAPKILLECIIYKLSSLGVGAIISVELATKPISVVKVLIPCFVDLETDPAFIQ